MKTYDFAHPRRRTIVVNRRQTALAIIDAFVAGLVFMLFVVLVLAVSYLIFG